MRMDFVVTMEKCFYCCMMSSGDKMAKQHWVVNYMDNVLYETDMYEPGTFMGAEWKLRNLV